MTLRTTTDQLVNEIADPFASPDDVKAATLVWFAALSATADDLHDSIEVADKGTGQRYWMAFELAKSVARAAELLPSQIGCETVPAEPFDTIAQHSHQLRAGEQVRFTTADDGLTPWLTIAGVTSRGEVGDAAYLILDGGLQRVVLGTEMVETKVQVSV